MRNSFVFLHTNGTSIAAATRPLFAKRYVVAHEARDRATQNAMFNTVIALRPCSSAKGAHPRKVFAKNLAALVMNGRMTTLREYPRKDAPNHRVFGNTGS